MLGNAVLSVPALNMAAAMSHIVARALHAVPMLCWRSIFKRYRTDGDDGDETVSTAALPSVQKDALQSLSKFWEDTSLWILLTVLYPESSSSE